MDYEKAKLLLFNYVDVLTNIRQAPDFAGSQFVFTSKQQNVTKGLNKLVYRGYLKVIDPLSKSVILCQIEGQSVTRNILVIGQNICDICLANEAQHETKLLSTDQVEMIIQRENQLKLSRHPYFHRSKTRLTPEEIHVVQASISEWLNKYMIPFTLDARTQEFIVAESVTIRPPYEHETDYVSPTRVTLKRIKHIVDSRHNNSE